MRNRLSLIYYLFVFAILLQITVSLPSEKAKPNPSTGCVYKHLPDGMMTDKLTKHTILIDDPRLKSVVTRHFYIRVPGTNQDPYKRDSNHERALTFYFHGYQGNALDVATKYEYNLMGRQEDMIMIYPEGLSDFVTDEGVELSDLQGWNAVGSSDSDDPKCIAASGFSQCGFKSCKELNICHSCAFASCNNDTLFVEEILDWAISHLCIDQSRIVATGLSNGGLMTYELITKRPDPFQAFIPIYGVPMTGFLNFSNPEIFGKPLLHIHGLNDEWIPFNGSLSNFNVSFVPATDVVEEYARVQGCSFNREIWSTPFDTINSFQCIEYPNCQTGAKVVLCTYSGGHTYPPMIEETTFYFLNQISEQPWRKETKDFASFSDTFAASYKTDLATVLFFQMLFIFCM